MPTSDERTQLLTDLITACNTVATSSFFEPFRVSSFKITDCAHSDSTVPLQRQQMWVTDQGKAYQTTLVEQLEAVRAGIKGNTDAEAKLDVALRWAEALANEVELETVPELVY